MPVLRWLRRHDPGYNAVRRAGRAAIVAPLLFLLGSRVIGVPEVAVFSAFGSFAMLLFVDFGGPLRERVQAQLGLAVAGAVLVCLGTLAGSTVWLSAAAMLVVGLVVLFSGSVSSVLASAGTALLLSFILPVTLQSSPASVGPRLLGWGIASLVSVVAIVALWPAPTREPLRGPAVEACRALAARLRAEHAAAVEDDPALAAERDRAVEASDRAVSALQEGFLATPYRPTGLSTPARTIVRLVDQLLWLNAVVAQTGGVRSASSGPRPSIPPAVRRVKGMAADVLGEAAVLLAQHAGDPAALEDGLERLRRGRDEAESAMLGPSPRPEDAGDLVGALDPGFRAQELATAVATIAGTVALTARAERRTWWQRVLNNQPGDLRGPVAAAAERAGGFLARDSVWLRNSIRGAVGLALAVLLAKLSGVDHSFWVVLGTLSVLRSNALSTGQTVLRGVLGTVAGVALGAAVLFVIGPHTAVLILVLPVAILVAGIAPAAISFAAGQAAFTVLLVVLFNIIAPTGWTVGLIRIEDVALGCAVSLVVGLLFWPRGAAAALRAALADAYTEGVRYLRAAATAGVTDDPERGVLAGRAAAASRRLDDAFRTYLAERGRKRRPLAEVSASIAGVAGLRSAGDAVAALWDGHEVAAPARPAVRAALEAPLDRIEAWYRELAGRLVARGPLPDPSPADPEGLRRLSAALRQHPGEDAIATAAAVRVAWTADYLEVVRRLESAIVTPVRLLSEDTGSRSH